MITRADATVADLKEGMFFSFTRSSRVYRVVLIYGVEKSGYVRVLSEPFNTSCTLPLGFKIYICS